MRRFVRTLIAVPLAAVLLAGTAGCPKTESTTKKPDDTKKDKGPAVRVEEKYGVTTEGAGG